MADTCCRTCRSDRAARSNARRVRTFAQTGIVLQVGATPAINVTLGLGELAETVTVEAAAPLVDTQSAGISEVVEQERIVELPREDAG